jgi:hypothetical protein
MPEGQDPGIASKDIETYDEHDIHEHLRHCARYVPRCEVVRAQRNQREACR